MPGNLVEITVRARDQATAGVAATIRNIRRELDALRRPVTARINVQATPPGALDDLRRTLDDLARTVTARVHVQATPPGMLDDLRQTIDDLARTVTAHVRVRVTPPGELGDLRRALDDLAHTVTARIRVDVSGLTDLDYLQDVIDRIEQRITAHIRVDVDGLDEVTDLRDALDELQTVIGDVDINITVDIDSIAEVIELNELLERIERHIRVRIDVDSDRGGAAEAAAGGIAGLIGKAREAIPELAKLALKIAAIGTTAVSAAPAIVHATSVAAHFTAQAAEAAPALVALAVAGKLVAGTLKLIFEKGSAMRTVLQPIADGIKKAGENASEAASRGLKPLVAEFNKAVWPEINHFMVQIGKSVNNVAKGFLGWAKSAEGVSTIKNILHPIWQSLDDLQGPILRVGVAFANMLGRIMGVSAAAGANGLTGVLNKLADKFDMVDATLVTEGFTRLKTAAHGVHVALSTVSEWLHKAADAYRVYQTQFGLVADAVAVAAIALGGPVVAVAGAVGLIIRHWDQLKAAYQSVVDYFAKTPVGMGFVAQLRYFADEVGPHVEDALGRIKAVAGPVFTEIGRTIRQDLIPAVGDFVQHAAPKVAEFIDALSGVVDRVLPHIIDMFRDMRTRVGPVLVEIGDVITQKVIPALTDFINAAAPIVEWFVDTLAPAVSRAIGDVVRIVKGGFEVITGVFDIVTALLSGDWGKFWDGVVSVLSGARDLAVGIVDALWNAIKTIFGGAIDIVVGIVERGIDLIIAPFRWLYDQIVGGSIIPDLVNGVIRWFSMLPRAVVDIVADMVVGAIKLFHELLDGALRLVEGMLGAFGKLLGPLGAPFKAAAGEIASFRNRANEDLSAAEARVRDTANGINNWLGGIRDKTVTITVREFRQSIASGVIPPGPAPGGHRASGGIVGAAGGGPRGSLTWVGEMGRELVRLPYGSTVIPHGQSEGMAARGRGGGREPLVLELRSSGRDIDDMLLQILRRAVRVRGGEVQLVLGT